MGNGWKYIWNKNDRILLLSVEVGWWVYGNLLYYCGFGFVLIYIIKSKNKLKFRVFSLK